MLPQCDPAILNDNPQFKILHQQLTTSILNPDGSTRALEGDGSRKQVQAELKKRQILSAKRRILSRVVCELPYDLKNSLPDELRDLVAVIALYLNHSTPANNKNDENDDTLALLQPDLDAFSAQLPNIVPAIRQKLAEDIANLRTLASKADNNHQSRIPQQTRNASTVADSRLRPLSLKLASSAVLLSQASLSSQIASRLRNLRTTQMVELLAAQRQMTVTAAEVLSAHTMVMERMVQVLERTKHGSLARAGRARAEYLAAVAEGLDGKVKLIQRDILTTIYTPETIEALQNYRRHLHDTRVHLRERERNALKQLEAYEAADSSAPRAGTMADIARRYAALAKEVENLKMEIKRIGGDE